MQPVRLRSRGDSCFADTTAPTSRVEVTSQGALSVEVPRISGKSGSSGTTSVCCSATTVPHRHRVATTAATGTARAGGAVAVVVGAANAASLGVVGSGRYRWRTPRAVDGLGQPETVDVAGADRACGTVPSVVPPQHSRP